MKKEKKNLYAEGLGILSEGIEKGEVMSWAERLGTSTNDESVRRECLRIFHAINKGEMDAETAKSELKELVKEKTDNVP